MRTVLAAACLLACAPAAPALAQTGPSLHDPATGLRIDLPAPFELAGKQDRPNYDIAVAVRSTTGAPKAANADGALCGIAVARAPSNEGLTQAEINAVLTEPAWLTNSKATLKALGKVEASEIFTQAQAPGAGVVKGGEFLIAPESGPGHETARLYIAMWETPRGRVVVTCAGLAAEAPAGVEAFRAIRRGVSLAGG